MLTIVFYFNKGAAAKLRAREIAAAKGNYSRVYDVTAWDGSSDKCDWVEIMPDVPEWQRDRITKVYGEISKEVDQEELTVVQEEEPEPARKPMGLLPAKKQAKHKGGGRWFVMEGEAVISGPHDKAEAQRLTEA